MHFIKKLCLLSLINILSYQNSALASEQKNNQEIATSLKLLVGGTFGVTAILLLLKLYKYIQKTNTENIEKIATKRALPVNIARTRVFKKPTITLKNIGGYQSLKKHIMDTVSSALLPDGDNFLPRAIVLYGEKGIGKSSIIEAITGELNYQYGECNAELFLDDSHFSFALLFDFIKKTVDAEKNFGVNKPKILLVNNFVFSYSKEEFEKSLSALENILKINNIPLIVVFSTNNPYVNLIGDLCQSPYCHFFFVPLPSYEERIEIIDAMVKNLDLNFNDSLNSTMIASLTVEFTAYNIYCLLQKALYFEAEGKENLNNIQISLISLKKAFSAIHRNTAEVMKKIPEKKSGVEYHLHTYSPIEKIPINFDDVIGHEHIKDSLKLIIEYLKNPKKFIDLGIKAPKGVILSGAPGTGKTFLAKALAKEANVPFFFISGSDFVSLYIGVGANNVRELFKTARAYAPCIVFIDEVDAVAINRKKLLNNNDSENRNTLNELLYQIDGFKDIDGIVIIAATNMIEEIDPALMRPGRLELHFNMPQLTFNDCQKLLSKLLRNKNYDSEHINFNYLARKILGFTGADITYFVNLAATLAMMRQSDVIELHDFNNAYQSMTLGHKINNLQIPAESLKETAIHEVGHCMCIVAQKNSPWKLDLITIEPRDIGNGAYLGANHYIGDEEELKCLKYEELLASIVTSLGGYVAEQLFLNTTTSGVSSDLQHATQKAYQMVRYYGMGSDLNAEIAHENNNKMSEKDRAKVEEILQLCKEKAKEIILANKEQFHTLVTVLLEKKTMFAGEVLDVLGDIEKF